jgi:hypothetical protein
VIFLLAGLLAIDSLWQALLPAALYLGFHLIEGETVTPMLLSRRRPRHHLARLLVLDVGYSGRDSLCAHAGDYSNRRWTKVQRHVTVHMKIIARRRRAASQYARIEKTRCRIVENVRGWTVYSAILASGIIPSPNATTL